MTEPTREQLQTRITLLQEELQEVHDKLRIAQALEGRGQKEEKGRSAPAVCRTLEGKQWTVGLCPRCGELSTNTECTNGLRHAPEKVESLRVVPAARLLSVERERNAEREDSIRQHEYADEWFARANHYRAALERVENHGAGHAVEIARRALQDGSE